MTTTVTLWHIPSVYTKLASAIIFSTVWQESDTTRLVWITMLAMKNRYGEVTATVPGLAHAARVSVDACEEAIRVLSSPDKHSSDYTGPNQGRRIERIDDGWHVINHDKYQRLANREEKLSKDAERQARKRKRDSPKSHAASAYADADADESSDSGRENYVLLSEPAAPAPDAIASVRSVFDEWRKVHHHQTAKLDAKRTARIRRALEHFTVEQLQQAIRGARKDAWLMGRDPKSPRKYDGLQTLLRDNAQIERLIELDAGPAAKAATGTITTEKAFNW